ncbi:unnamed protein product [Meloidogyne enterolobii]|uniref:Uncharacterized protein n=1 Tax=Meloidogyne enterolobii TaxID=390850 RepID=A0ACB0XYI9_MELEN
MILLKKLFLVLPLNFLFLKQNIFLLAFTAKSKYFCGSRCVCFEIILCAITRSATFLRWLSCFSLNLLSLCS